MPGTFPVLKTAALAQYPLERVPRFAVETVEFLDFKKQLYRDLASGRRQWVVSLEKLDEPEIARLKEFFEQQKGRWGTFSFTDPWDGTVHPNCSFADDALPQQNPQVGQHQARLVIYEHA